ELNLIENLGLDSLDMAELLAFLDDQYDVTDVAPQELPTVGSVYVAAMKQGPVKETQEPKIANLGWNAALAHHRLKIEQATTIPEAFLKACDERLFQIACADPYVGSMSYFKVKRGCLILQKLIQNMPGERIGILLPASCTAIMCVLACQMAGKIPVMINWTV